MQQFHENHPQVLLNEKEDNYRLFKNLLSLIIVA